MNEEKVFCTGWYKENKKNNLLKRNKIKVIISIFIVALFIGVSLNTAIAKVSTSSDDNDDCGSCGNDDPEVTIRFIDLTEEEQAGLVAMVLLYMRFKTENKIFDSLSESDKADYLNNLVSYNQLWELYDIVDDAEIKYYIQSVISVVEDRTKVLDYTSYDSDFSANNFYPMYIPGECTKLIAGAISTFYNKNVKPAMELIGYTLSTINWTAVAEIAAQTVLKIIEITPNPGLLLLSQFFKGVAKIGIWYVENVLPIIRVLKAYPIICISIGISVVGFTLWSVLTLIHILCKHNLCEPGDNDDTSKSKNFLLDINNKLAVFIQKILLLITKKNIKQDDQEATCVLNDNNAPVLYNFQDSIFKNRRTIRVKCNTEITFYIRAVDPDEDDLYYVIDWGDGDIQETIYYKSGEGINIEHSWVKEGTYNLEAKAVDIHGAESEKNGDSTLECIVSETPVVQKSSFLFKNIFSLFLERMFLFK